jgi:hypothetical protein
MAMRQFELHPLKVGAFDYVDFQFKLSQMARQNSRPNSTGTSPKMPLPKTGRNDLLQGTKSTAGSLHDK